MMIAGDWDPTGTTPMDFLAGTFTVFSLLSMEVKTQVAGVNLHLNAEGFTMTHLRFLEFFFE